MQDEWAIEGKVVDDHVACWKSWASYWTTRGERHTIGDVEW